MYLKTIAKLLLPLHASTKKKTKLHSSKWYTCSADAKELKQTVIFQVLGWVSWSTIFMCKQITRGTEMAKDIHHKIFQVKVKQQH